MADISKLPPVRYAIVGFDSKGKAFWYHEPSGIFVNGNSHATIYEEKPSDEFVSAFSPQPKFGRVHAVPVDIEIYVKDQKPKQISLIDAVYSLINLKRPIFNTSR